VLVASARPCNAFDNQVIDLELKKARYIQRGVAAPVALWVGILVLCSSPGERRADRP